MCASFNLRGLAHTANREAQLDSFELRHLARATNREAQLDSCELRHLAHATLEAQLDWCELRHFVCTTLEAQLDSCGLRHLAHAANSTRSDFLLWHSPRWELLVAAIDCSAKDSSSDFLT